MSIVAGAWDTSNFTTDHAKKSFAASIARLMPNGAAPLFALSSMLKRETAVATEHGFFTKTMVFPEGQLNGAILAADTTLTLDSTTNLLPGMIMRIDSTGENIIINTVVDATDITVTRSVGSVVAADAADNVQLFQVGNAFEESSDRPNAADIQPVKVTNLTQIFRNTWALSGSVRATLTIAGESNVAESRQDCGAFHAADIDKATIFGQKSSSTRNGRPFRTMDGLVSIVGNLTYYPPSYSAANVYTAGATTNFTQLEGFLDPCFDQATDPKVANERLLFVGGTARKVINAIGRLNGTYQLTDGQTSFGLQFDTFKLSRGTFRVIEHPLLNTNTSWARMALAVDLSTFGLAYLGDRDTKHESFGEGNGSDSGVDATGGTLTTELTAVIKNPPANGVIYNLTAGATG